MRARVTLLGDYAEALGGNRKEHPQFQANVFVNGSAAVINGRPLTAGDSDERVDRILDAVTTQESDTAVTISGRSEYLQEMGLMPADQKVSFRVEGGKCEGC
jgi:hypothetical protein